MTFLDWLIAGVLFVLAVWGYRKGIVSQVFDLLGSIFAVIGAFYFFERAGAVIAPILRISLNLANIVGFILVALVISVAFGFAGREWRKYTKSTAISWIDSWAGAVFGVFKGLVIMIFVFMVMVSTPWNVTHQPVENSFLAQDVLRLTPVFYYLQERSLPANVPRLMISPEGLQLRKFNYQSLDGATCIVCHGKVRYDGLKGRGIISFPHFTCTNCGRVSDGCLTFEGYHLLYGRCPYQDQKVLNCKVWPNPTDVHPKGICPVCRRRGFE